VRAKLLTAIRLIWIGAWIVGSMAVTLATIWFWGWSIIRSIDPLQDVNEVRGELLSWGARDAASGHDPRAKLIVRTDDGRLVHVESNRYLAPQVGERIVMQERIGRFGTRRFVEMAAQTSASPTR
jgi:hypothetical protein